MNSWFHFLLVTLYGGPRPRFQNKP
jgi:hypothetical protein